MGFINDFNGACPSLGMSLNEINDLMLTSA